MPDARRAAPADLQRLLAFFRAGQAAEMARLAEALSGQHPDDAEVWKAWGTALLMQGQDAVAALQRAQALLPDDADLSANLAQALAAQGRHDEALAAWQLGLRLRPGALALQRSLALQLQNMGRHDESAHTLQLALQQHPGHAALHDQLGQLLQASAQPEAAAAQYRLALQSRPGEAAYHFHLGNALVDAGQHAAALASFAQALVLRPGLVPVLVNLGAALLTLDRPRDALPHLLQAAALQPGQALVRMNLGNALLAGGQVSAALDQLSQAVALAPGSATAHSNLAHALKASGQPEAAQACFERALALAPDELALHSAALFNRQYLADHSAGEDAGQDAGKTAGQGADQALAAARRFGAHSARRAQPYTRWAHAAAPAAGQPLRVGLLSPDLRQHPVGYFSESVLAALAQGAGGPISLLAYASQRVDDGLSQRLRASCSVWREVAGLDDAALAEAIHADGVHVLLDLAGHTLGNRLAVLAWRPAPVQASWLGWCASTGLAGLDAYIGDQHITPTDGAQSAQPRFTEPLLNLPDSFLCFTPPQQAPALTPLPALAGTGLRLGCLNQLAKMGEPVVALWSRVLHALPGSVLVLQAAPLQDEGICQQVRQRYARHGIAGHRLQLLPAQPRAQYLATLGGLDMVLDPFPYPGGTTTLEALFMGLPVLTLPGATPLSRQGLSILHTLGLHDWVAADADDYLARALRHAGDLPALQRLRQSLRGRLLASPLCDAPRFAGHLGAVLWRLWQASAAGQAGVAPGTDSGA